MIAADDALIETDLNEQIRRVLATLTPREEKILRKDGSGEAKALAGELAPAAGTVSYGYRVRPAYFAQDLGSLDPDATVWETLWETGALDNQQTIHALNQFLFAGDAIQKQVGDLSGGERTRLALCKLLAYNITSLIHSQCELGIEPIFWPKLGR